jgi:hypothetical protein
VLSRDWKILQMHSNSSSGSGSGSASADDILRSLNREAQIISRLWRDEGPGPQNLITELMTSYELFEEHMKLNQEKQVHICHLSGHGSTRSLVFQDDAARNDDNLQEPDPMAFASEVVDNGVRCLVLNSCNSGDRGRDVSRCARKKGKRVVVVCWDSPVVSSACEEVTDTFYRSILQSTQEGAGAVDDIFVAAEKAFQAVERKHHAGCLGKHLRDCVDDPKNRFAIARCGHEGLWRYSVDSDGQWDWEPIERRAQADDGMEDFPLPDDHERLRVEEPMKPQEDANRFSEVMEDPSDPYSAGMMFSSLRLVRGQTPVEASRSVTNSVGMSKSPAVVDESTPVARDLTSALEPERAPTEPCMETDQGLDGSSTVAKSQAARENRLDRLAQSQPAIEAGEAPVLTLDVALQTAQEPMAVAADVACAPGMPDDFDDAPDFDDDF